MRTLTTTITVTPVERYAFLDLTDDLRRAVKDAGVTDGLAVAYCAHTTCALLINEWEDGALDDFRRHLVDLVPHEGAYYRHDDFEIRTQNLQEDERKNGHAHVKAMLLSATSHAIPVVGGEPSLGTWQRLLLFELDEPKDRVVTMQVMGS
ncbi:MAG TPA: secondary thiamine-phosphate synthase enzyme YjbQ [Actinomycetota bacterium]|nr:secondary thiamine-phosphate synthase enzyme YjbQ [Actinomycetota bacterium]